MQWWSVAGRECKWSHTGRGVNWDRVSLVSQKDLGTRFSTECNEVTTLKRSSARECLWRQQGEFWVTCCTWPGSHYQRSWATVIFSLVVKYSRNRLIFWRWYCSTLNKTLAGILYINALSRLMQVLYDTFNAGDNFYLHVIIIYSADDEITWPLDQHTHFLGVPWLSRIQKSPYQLS